MIKIEAGGARSMADIESETPQVSPPGGEDMLIVPASGPLADRTPYAKA